MKRDKQKSFNPFAIKPVIVTKPPRTTPIKIEDDNKDWVRGLLNESKSPPPCGRHPSPHNELTDLAVRQKPFHLETIATLESDDGVQIVDKKELNAPVILDGETLKSQKRKASGDVDLILLRNRLLTEVAPLNGSTAAPHRSQQVKRPNAGAGTTRNCQQCSEQNVELARDEIVPCPRSSSRLPPRTSTQPAIALIGASSGDIKNLKRRHELFLHNRKISLRSAETRSTALSKHGFRLLQQLREEETLELTPPLCGLSRSTAASMERNSQGAMRPDGSNGQLLQQRKERAEWSEQRRALWPSVRASMVARQEREREREEEARRAVLRVRQLKRLCRRLRMIIRTAERMFPSAVAVVCDPRQSVPTAASSFQPNSVVAQPKNDSVAASAEVLFAEVQGIKTEKTPLHSDLLLMSLGARGTGIRRTTGARDTEGARDGGFRRCPESERKLMGRTTDRDVPELAPCFASSYPTPKGPSRHDEPTHVHGLEEEYDVENEYGSDGYDEKGYDREGFCRAGFDHDGFDRNGYDRRRRDWGGYDTEGYDTEGFDRDGLNRDGYDWEGYDWMGFNAEGFDRWGYDDLGYGKDGSIRGQVRHADGMDKPHLAARQERLERLEASLVAAEREGGGVAAESMAVEGKSVGSGASGNHRDRRWRNRPEPTMAIDNDDDNYDTTYGDSRAEDETLDLDDDVPYAEELGIDENLMDFNIWESI